MVRLAYLRVRKLVLKIQKFPILQRYKFSKWRMLRFYSEYLEKWVIYDEYMDWFCDKWMIPLWSRLLFFNFKRKILEEMFRFKGTIPSPDFEIKKIELKQKFVFNLWLNGVSPIAERTPEELRGLSEPELYKLLAEAGFPWEMWEELWKIPQDIYKGLTVSIFVSAEG